MKNILILMFIFFGLVFTINSNAQSSKNVTENIRVEVIENDQEWLIKYNITHTFNGSSDARHGIFFDISKNQDNVMYDFTLVDKPLLDDKTVKYETISELTSYRIRFGDKDILVAPGTHHYQFSIKTKMNVDYNHEFRFFYGWQDPLNSANIIYKGEDICSKQTIDCINNPFVTLNESKPRANPFLTMIQVLQAYFWVALGSIILWFSLLKNQFTDRFRINHTNDIPFYSAPKGMKPWEIESVINKGKMDTKETLAAYILYLNYKNYLTIIPKSQEDKKLKIQLLKPLPYNWLPLGYNDIINSMIEYGVEDGMVESKVLESQLDAETEEYILKDNAKLYNIKPELEPLSTTLLTTLFVGIALFVLYSITKSYLLIGTSSFVFIIFCFLISMIILFLYLYNKDKFNQEGYDTYKEAAGYKYYISRIESEKLNFDNNPEEGAKFYLENVPYAAQFGVLEKFNKYFRSLEFMQPETVATGVLLSNSLSYSSFYTPPSSSSGGGFGGGGGGFSGGGGSW
jgi:uncharacterized membrane protein YgcG